MKEWSSFAIDNQMFFEYVPYCFDCSRDYHVFFIDKYLITTPNERTGSRRAVCVRKQVEWFYPKLQARLLKICSSLSAPQLIHFDFGSIRIEAGPLFSS